MSRQPQQSAVSSPRLLASAIGMAITAGSAGHMAFAAQQTDEKASGNAIALDATSVVGEQQDTSYKTDASQSKKYTAPLRETPKSVTVIPQQVIRDTGATSLVDALRTTPGITFGAGEGGNPAGDRPIIRGFNAESDVFIDGMRDPASQSREIFDVESVEVSKGPGSAFTGAGSTGGSLNLVSKTAKLGSFYNGGFTWGSDQTKRTTLDLNQQMTDTSAFRLNLMKHEANVAGRDGVDVSRWGVAPTFSFGLGTDTRVIVGYYHNETDDIPDYGIPLTSSSNRSKYHVDKPANVNRDNFYGLTSRDYRQTSDDSGTFKIEHDLNDDLTVSNSFRMSRSTLDYIVSNPDDSKGNVANGSVYRGAKSRNSTSSGWVNQTDLSAKFNTAGIEHSLVTGLEFSYQDTHNRPYVLTSSASGTTCNAALFRSGDCTNLYKPTPGDNWSGKITDSAAYTDTDTKTAAAYVFDTLKFNEQWSLNLGLRYDNYQTESSGYSTGGRGAVAGNFSRENTSDLLNYQIGVVYNPLPNGSVYAAYSTSSNPAGETSGNGSLELAANNSDLDPEKNRNYEIGTKWDFFGDDLSLTAALFRTEKTNARIDDPDGATTQVLDGEQVVNGLELTYSGKLTRNWKVFGGYTYMDSEVVKTTLAADKGNHMPSTPRNNFTLWSTYDLIPEKLTIGGGATFVDSQFGNVANSVEIPSYWRYDAMATYALTKNVDLQLNVQNLTDKRYFDQVFQTHYAHVASGRTALLSANFHF
ncbi:catecholate siderophore receptor [Pseudomonas koreensis]|uniref:TonB-dependent receptor n=1 Tax=Pseudomonas koreensis TaxID=198620 RepID=UPI00087B0467|nr:TonB-dependent siderophore receptor [Pseudomonas koreensis]KAB0516336.1 TonB-dependent siderophore receptor [Pseudomonas koreensis]NNA60424.1 TonB-dependent siderophore receptor [Pseudomonas koreensis]SDD15008.1 catecholate siderophore receptor [Pseudomonas koreensis]